MYDRPNKKYVGAEVELSLVSVNFHGRIRDAPCILTARAYLRRAYFVRRVASIAHVRLSDHRAIGRSPLFVELDSDFGLFLFDAPMLYRGLNEPSKDLFACNFIIKRSTPYRSAACKKLRPGS